MKLEKVKIQLDGCLNEPKGTISVGGVEIGGITKIEIDPINLDGPITAKIHVILPHLDLTGVEAEIKITTLVDLNKEAKK